MKSVLLIYTGGTIGMKVDPVDGALKPFDFSQITSEVPEIANMGINIDSCSFDPLIDSSDVEYSMWIRLVELIKDNYEKYDGFVVLHGTDTMSYSASALSFMLENLTKAVVFTGSQLPIGTLRTDGRENLITAIEIAAATDSEDHSIVPEVSIYFADTLIRGNRTTKLSADNFSAFYSFNYPPLAEAGINIRYNTRNIRYPASWDAPLVPHTDLDTRVGILKLHPGITEQVARSVVLADACRAVIVETYGSGNAPSSGWFPGLIEEAVSQGKIIVNKTQCLSGKVNMGVYAGGRLLRKAGVLSADDATLESTLAKLFYLMGRFDSNRDVKNFFEKDLRGEISE